MSFSISKVIISRIIVRDGIIDQTNAFPQIWSWPSCRACCAITGQSWWKGRLWGQIFKVFVTAQTFESTLFSSAVFIVRFLLRHHYYYFLYLLLEESETAFDITFVCLIRKGLKQSLYLLKQYFPLFLYNFFTCLPLKAFLNVFC